MLYPANIKKKYIKKVNYANRGMPLEALINSANDYYKNNDIAIIYKKPTPITISNVCYEENKKVLTKGYFNCKSTLDYVGLYKGKYLDFDAKSSKSKTSFPLKNLSFHQLKHIENIIKHKGIAFLIIEMNNLIFLLKGEDLISFINNNYRKSIPFDYIKEVAFEIPIQYNPSIDYLKILDKVYF